MEQKEIKTGSKKEYFGHGAPHAVTSRDKLARMVRTLRSGGDLPPVLSDGDSFFEGSHRIVAWEIMGMDVDYVQVQDQDWDRVAEIMDCDKQDLADMPWTDESYLGHLWDAVNAR